MTDAHTHDMYDKPQAGTQSAAVITATAAATAAAVTVVAALTATTASVGIAPAITTAGCRRRLPPTAYRRPLRQPSLAEPSRAGSRHCSRVLTIPMAGYRQKSRWSQVFKK